MRASAFLLLPGLGLALVPGTVLVCGCRLGTPKTVVADTSDTGDTGDTAETADDTDSEDSADSSDDTGNAFDRDDDGDGYSENEGDCNDADPLVHPEAEDACDGVDNDCDGESDEDARGDDPHEPNDTEDEWAWIGSLEDVDSIAVAGWLHNDDDVDRYAFYVDDPTWTSFGFTVSLSNIPADANYVLTVGRLQEDGSLSETQELFGSESLEIPVSGEAGVDDSGNFGVIVEALGGADCSQSYLLTVVE